VGNRITSLIKWEQAFDEARGAKTKVDVVALIERGCDEGRRLCKHNEDIRAGCNDIAPLAVKNT
jgi:hypothetical protein